MPMGGRASQMSQLSHSVGGYSRRDSNEEKDVDMLLEELDLDDI